MKNKISILSVLIAVLCICGCDNIAFMKSYYKQQKEIKEKAKEPVISFIDDTDLAKIILTPKVNKDFDFSRDPFQPLGKGNYMSAFTSTADTNIGNVAYLGIVKIGDEFSALIQTENNKGVYKINDQVNNKVTIIDIHEDYVMLEKGDEQYKIKRGE
ncbi:MAG: hypothetical protein H6755_07515 [Candidatus Omnitrophica bacterium]|nr:hypothetical protein [Candidatus Omnitrophota bacterium]MCB9748240.1 hypothetical protein [Candidatus Omnitrophota bacterium]